MIRSKVADDAFVPNVAQQIRLLRKRQKFSQQTLAKASGLSRNTLSLIERGRISPTLVTLEGEKSLIQARFANEHAQLHQQAENLAVIEEQV